MTPELFAYRHIGPRKSELKDMLETIGVSSVDELVEKTIPESIRLNRPLKIPGPVSEPDYLKHIKTLAGRNKLFKSYIGCGYYNTFTPSVIRRNIFENPGWYTAYTPYQAEISQGRLEALLNFQTMVADMTGLPIANASLLDEGTAAAEGMLMLYAARPKNDTQKKCNFFISDECFPQTIEVILTRAEPLAIKITVGNWQEFIPDESCFGAMVQYPAANGSLYDYREFVKKNKESGIRTVVAADLLSLTLLSPPGEWGADVVAGNTQRFGIPLGYGGPHAAYFAAKNEYKRFIPGRIIGVAVDASGNPAYRMALQTREQHIKREKATSNICTAQALLAIMAGMYAVYHGPEGLTSIAKNIHHLTVLLSGKLQRHGIAIVNKLFFDTLTIRLPEGILPEKIKATALNHGINFAYSEDLNKDKSWEKTIRISLDETTDEEDIEGIADVFRESLQPETSVIETNNKISQNGHRALLSVLPDGLARHSLFLQHPVFHKYHSETALMRYIKTLENRDLSLTHSMISLGSCTMKLNAATELFPLMMEEFSAIHPFVPAWQAQGFQSVISELEKFLCEITGMDALSFQPNSGAQGEYCGLLVIREYFKNRGEHQRNVALIPQSAHGTNPASAAMAGFNIIIVRCDENGNIDIRDVREKAALCKDRLAAMMVTYPSTHGVFEEDILEINEIIHENGGQVYMDGANLNAQVGLTHPGLLGADVCHINLHKTFGIPHGGGGPGMGPIAVKKHLAPFLPQHVIIPVGGEKGSPSHIAFGKPMATEGSAMAEQGIHAVSSAPYGSALILLISYGYIKMLGNTGLTQATKFAILNANYIAKKLASYYPVVFKGKNGFSAHEFIADCREFKHSAGIDVVDIAKRLMDFGFHAPTVSFPIPGTLMIEPTESESKEELDRFCEAMISIRKEISEAEAAGEGSAFREDNPLKNAPHTAHVLSSDGWNHPYKREKAVFPLPWVKANKFWPAVSRIDNAYGDRNLVCTCIPAESYSDSVKV